jgi:hypothetical protein
MFNAILLEPQAPSRKKDICLARCGEIGYPVADEDDQRHFIGETFGLGFCAGFVDGEGFVVA